MFTYIAHLQKRQSERLLRRKNVSITGYKDIGTVAIFGGSMPQRQLLPDPVYD